MTDTTNDRQYTEESMEPMTLLTIVLLGPPAIALVYHMSVLTYVVYQLVTKGKGGYEVYKEVKKDVKKYKREFKELREQYKEKLDKADSKSERERVLSKFSDDLEKHILDVIKELDRKHQYGVLKKASKDDIRRMVRRMLQGYAKKNRQKLRKYSEKSSFETLSSSEIAELYNDDGFDLTEQFNFDQMLVTAKLEDYYVEEAGLGSALIKVFRGSIEIVFGGFIISSVLNEVLNSNKFKKDVEDLAKDINKNVSELSDFERQSNEIHEMIREDLIEGIIDLALEYSEKVLKTREYVLIDKKAFKKKLDNPRIREDLKEAIFKALKKEKNIPYKIRMAIRETENSNNPLN